MYDVEVDRIPKIKRRRLRNRNNNSIVRYLDNFMSRNVRSVKLMWTNEEYADADSVWTSVWCTVKREKLPIRVIKRDNEVYLKRKDI